jgi:hypothetical protein
MAKPSQGHVFRGTAVAFLALSLTHADLLARHRLELRARMLAHSHHYLQFSYLSLFI